MTWKTAYGYGFRESLLKSVDITQLLKMREFGMSNREIADQLDCSYATILKYLGPQSKKS